MQLHLSFLHLKQLLGLGSSIPLNLSEERGRIDPVLWLPFEAFWTTVPDLWSLFLLCSAGSLTSVSTPLWLQGIFRRELESERMVMQQPYICWGVVSLGLPAPLLSYWSSMIHPGCGQCILHFQEGNRKQRLDLHYPDCIYTLDFSASSMFLSWGHWPLSGHWTSHDVTPAWLGPVLFFWVPKSLH